MLVWISTRFIPAKDIPINYPHHCLSCEIPDKCVDCQHSNTIYNNMIGSKDGETCFNKVCPHYQTYNKIWANRIQSVPAKTIHIQFTIAKNKVIDPTKDGMKCGGSCGQWNPMAVPNRDDGSFVCYSCRTGF